MGLANEHQNWTDEPIQLWQNKTWRRLLSIKSNSYCRIRESLHSTGKKQLLRVGGGRRELSKPIIASSHLPIRKVTASPIGQSEWRAWRESGILHFPMKFHKEVNSHFLLIFPKALFSVKLWKKTVFFIQILFSWRWDIVYRWGII